MGHGTHTKNYFVINPSDLNNNVVSIGGIIVPRVRITNNFENQYPPTFVPTLKTISAIRQLAKKIKKRKDSNGIITYSVVAK